MVDDVCLQLKELSTLLESTLIDSDKTILGMRLRNS